MGHPFDPPVPPPGSYGSVPPPPGSFPAPPPVPGSGGYTTPLPVGPPAAAHGVTGAFPTQPVPAPPPGPTPHTAGPDGGGAGVLEIGRSPVGWTVAAIVVAAVAVVLGVVAFASGEQVGWAWLAWALAGPVAIGLLAGYTIHDTRRQAYPIYNELGTGVVLYWASIAVAAVAIGISAWTIADWWARL